MPPSRSIISAALNVQLSRVSCLNHRVITAILGYHRQTNRPLVGSSLWRRRWRSSCMSIPHASDIQSCGTYSTRISSTVVNQCDAPFWAFDNVIHNHISISKWAIHNICWELSDSLISLKLTGLPAVPLCDLIRHAINAHVTPLSHSSIPHGDNIRLQSIL